MSKMLSGLNSPIYDKSTEPLIYTFERNNGVMQGESSANISQTNFNFITYRIPDLFEKDSSIEVTSANTFFRERSVALKRQYTDVSTLKNLADLPSNLSQF